MKPSQTQPVYGEEIALLRQHGQRVTPQRLHVLYILRAANKPLSADEVAAEVMLRQPMDMATVYRVLTTLQTTGLVVQLTPEQGRQRYKYRDPGDLHHHLVCNGCGRDVQIADSSFDQLRGELAQRHGFTLQIDHLLLSGLCAECQATEPE